MFKKVVQQVRPQIIALVLTLLQGIPARSENGAISGSIEHDHSHVHGTHPECSLPKTAMDVVRCARSESPTVKRARLATEQAMGLTRIARQLLNPEVDVQSGFGKVNNEDKSEIQIGIRQNIDWGGQRNARIRAAKAEQNQSKASESGVEADIIIETIQKLVRLRQIIQEKGAVAKTIEDLNRIVIQQRSRVALTPEQQGALSVYKMALADHRLRESEIFEEERTLEHFFHLTTGHSLRELAKILPPEPKNWPQLEDSPKENQLSPSMNLAIANRELALSQVDAAHAAAWPNLSVGPQMTLEKEGGRSNTLWGVALVMGLPVFHLNGALKAHARDGLARAESLVNLNRVEESHERSEQLLVYRNALEALRQSPTLDTIEQDHSQNEKLANRGLISGSLLVESHRQRNDLLRARNARESKAFVALWTIYKFDGRVFKESL